MQWFLEAAMLRILWWMSGMLSIEHSSALGRRVFQCVGPRTNKHRHVLANLKMAFPEKSQVDIEQLGAEVWGNIGAVLTEFAHLKELTKSDNNNTRLEIIRKADRGEGGENKPCIYVGAHLANWELAAVAGQLDSGRLEAVYNPQANTWLERMVQKKRKPLGCNYVSNANVMRTLYKLLQRGRSVGMLVDLRADGGKASVFFGKQATTTTAPAWLSLKTRCDIVPVQVERTREANYRITYHPSLRAEAIDGESQEQTIARITQEINRLVESWIRAHPEDWMCTIRRWPKQLMRDSGAYS
jgi:KDO2-lipid IV(A) lauroyltransferase